MHTLSSVLDSLNLSWPNRVGQGLAQFAELGLAFVLSSLIGLEREIRQKSAGLRTHTLVGVGTALFVEVSKFGFVGVPGTEAEGIDPSRVAAQIVTGIGFIGGGLIFVRRDSVRGITTAASIWLTCAVGMACGASLPLLALGTTALYFTAVFGYTPLVRRLGGAPQTLVQLRLSYRPGAGVLPQVLVACTRRGFRVTDVTIDRLALLDDEVRVDDKARDKQREDESGGQATPSRVTSVVLQLESRNSLEAMHALVTELGDLPGVARVGGRQLAEQAE
jgi:putative Mg2+ transporter-C (MgtC) family protein